MRLGLMAFFGKLHTKTDAQPEGCAMSIRFNPEFSAGFRYRMPSCLGFTTASIAHKTDV
jgi:hypothetical protein